MNPSNTLSTALRPFVVLLLGLSALLLAAVPSAGQASLAAEDRIDEIPVTVGGVETSYTVLRDARVRDQWYYVPTAPRLTERTEAGTTLPELALIRYQARDPEDPQALLEAGLLQFSASLALPAEALPQLEAAIRSTLEAAGADASEQAVRLAALPFKEATVRVYTPGEGELVAGAPHGAGIAPTFATQSMAFSIPLTRVGSDVYDELVDGATGVPVVVEMTYSGLTPAAGFKVEVDWDQTYDFYSKNQKFAARAAWKGLVGGSVDVDHTKMRETLEENRCIKVMVTEGETLSAEQIDKHLEPILARINKELIARLEPPKKIAPKEAAKPSASGKFLSLGYSVAVRDVEQVKKGKEVIDFNVRQIQTRRTVASGFLGVGRYPEEVRERLVTVVPEGPWKSAFFVLPAVGDSDELGIHQVDLEIGIDLSTDDGERTIHGAQVAVWTPEKGWRDRDGRARTVLTFPLMGLEARGDDLTDARFASRAQITAGRDVLRIEQSRDVFDGETAIATPLAAVEVAAVDASLLSWNKIDPESPLAAVNVRLKSGERRTSGRLRPKRIDGEWMEPEPMFWLVEKGDAPVTADISFLLRSGERIDWSHSGADLLETQSSLEVTLVDGDWQPDGTRATR
ncbi:MAG: hypothetical protein AAGC60_16420 [Acidobacteriota bacterium]